VYVLVSQFVRTTIYGTPLESTNVKVGTECSISATIWADTAPSDAAEASISLFVEVEEAADFVVSLDAITDAGGVVSAAVADDGSMIPNVTAVPVQIKSRREMEFSSECEL
jgi:hypothetical protein